jgi:hypothetical protein
MKTAFLRFLLIFVCGFFAHIAKAQKIYFTIQHTFGDELLVLGEEGFHSKTDSTLQISELKYYISNISFYKKGTCIFNEPNSYRLLDVATCNPCTFEVTSPKKIKYDKIQFTLGIDSLTNVSGVLEGDLDPTKGMYWTWQSGYINFKLEGSGKLNDSTDKEFQFHLGGYLPPFFNAQTIQFKPKNKEKLVLGLDIKTVLNSIDLNKESRLMSPSTRAVELSEVVSNSFYQITK